MELFDVPDKLIDLLPAVIDTLAVYSKISNTRTPGTADALSLLYSVCNFEFIICLVAVKKCLSLVKSLAKSLKERQLDAGCALANVFVVKN